MEHNTTYINDMNILHQETLQTLCALQYYMSNLAAQKTLERHNNYRLSFQIMQQIVVSLLDTLPKNNILEYPLELTLIQQNLKNINKKIKSINT
jgi:hypothetical protein